MEGPFRSDHYLSGDGRVGRGGLDAWATLAALAGRTDRIRLGTMVSPVTFRHPSVLMSLATTVDHLSDGRVELGLGAGWYELEHLTFGIPFPSRRERMELLEEQLEIVHRQWADPEFSFAGSHYTLERCAPVPKPVQRPHPPIIVGGSGKPRTIAAAVRFADEYNFVVPDVPACRSVREQLDRECDRVGRDPASMRLSILGFNAVVGADRADLKRRVDSVLAELGPGSATGLLSKNRDDWFTGTLPEVAERLRDLAAVGVDRMILQHLRHGDVDAIGMLGRELQPLVATA